jgi:acetyl-CoA acetyltransferase
VDVVVAGVGLVPFGRHPALTGLDMGVSAARLALRDAGMSWDDLDFAVGGTVGPALQQGGATADTMVGRVGLTGIPFVNIMNGCATGGSALALARDAILSGSHDIALVVGFDKHPRGAFDPDPELMGIGRWYGETGMMLTTQFFGMKIAQYLHTHGLDASILARCAAKNYRNGALNPSAWRRKPLTEAQIEASPMLNAPLTQYMLCSPAEGAAAVVLCRGDLASRYTDTPVYLRAVSFRTRRFGGFEVMSPWLPLDDAPAPTVAAAQDCFDAAGLGPADVDVVQLQDTDAGSELIHLAECGFCADGEQEKLIATGATEIGGTVPVNTDGGLLANGEPVGASGLRQVHEIVQQLRGRAGDRQVPGDPRVGFTQVYGTPGVSACAVLSR